MAVNGDYAVVLAHGLLILAALLLWLVAVGPLGPAVVAHGLSYPESCGIFPDQELNPCPLHSQVDS